MIERRYERVSFLCKLELIPQPHGSALEAHSIDVSLGGVGAVFDANLEPGQLLSVVFCGKDAEGDEWKEEILGRAVHFRAEVDINKIGIQFLQPLNELEHPRLMRKVLGL